MSILVYNEFDVVFIKFVLTPDIEVLAVVISVSRLDVLSVYTHLDICAYRPQSGVCETSAQLSRTFYRIALKQSSPQLWAISIVTTLVI